MVSHIFKMEECEVTFYPGWLWRESIWTKKSCQGDEINILKWIMINIITIITAKRKKKSSPSSPLITNDHRRKKKMVTIISRSRLSAQIEKIPPQDSFHASKQGQHHHPQQNHLWQEYDKIKNNMNKCSNLNLNPIAPKISNKSERNFFQFVICCVSESLLCLDPSQEPHLAIFRWEFFSSIFSYIRWEWFCFVYLSNLKDFYPYLGVGLSLVFNFDFVILNQQTWSLVLEPVERFKIN